MKRLILIFLTILLFCVPALSQEPTDVVKQQLLIPFNGKWDSTHNSLLIGKHNFSDIQNLRYTDKSLKGVSGYSKINSTALTTYLKIRNGFHFTKDQPSESHVLVQAYNSGLTGSQILQNTTAIPDTGDFSGSALHTDASGANLGRFSSAPQGNVVYCNGEESMIWGGDELRCAGFINYDPDGSFLYDFGEQVNNTLTDSKNIATLTSVTAGIGSNTVLLLHLDNNDTDSSATPHTVTDTNVTYSTTTKVFGTHSAVFNGTNAVLTVPDHNDFNFSDGTFAIDARIQVDDLANNHVIFYQKTDIESQTFTLGTTEFTVGETITGAVSAETAIVDHWTLSGGSWAGNDAAGTLYVHTVSGVFQNEAIAGDVSGAATLSNDFADKGDNYVLLQVTTAGAVQALVYECYGAGSNVVTFSTLSSTISASTWYHVELDENGDDWYLFINGVQKGYVSDSNRTKNYISIVKIGYENTNYYDGFIDEYRVSNIARHTTEFEIPSTAYSDSSTAYFYIGSTRPLQGFKTYVQTANTSTSTMSVYYWDDSQWLLTSSLSDGTASGGKSLARTGSVTFTSTESTAKEKYIEGVIIYWYKVVISDVSANTSISYATVNAPFQDIKNTWAGYYSTPVSCKKYDGTTYQDYTIEVNDSNTSTVAILDSLGTSHYLLLGFVDPQQGFDVSFVGDKANSNAAALTVYCHNGTTWTDAGKFTSWDGTAEGDVSASKTGVIVFAGLDRGIEFSQTINGEGPYYFYKLQWSAALDGEVEIYYVAGIPNPDDILPYDFAFSFQNRVLLCSEDGDGSLVRVSGENAPDVYNGSDSTILSFGSQDDLTAGISVFNRFGSSIYNFAVLTKKTETWLLNGYAVSGDGQFRKYQISDNLGCPAPLTMVACEVGYSIGEDAIRNVIIWLSYSGPVIFDGGILRPIKGVEPYFDPNDSRFIDYDDLDDAVGFFDSLNNEYNLLIGDLWLIYDLLRDRWTKKVPATYPECGFMVQDTDGAQYTYLGLDTGYLLRNEYGNDFDGSAIEQSVTFSALLPTDSLWEEVRLDFMKFLCEAKNDGDQDSVSAYHRMDGDTDWTVLTDIPMYAAGKETVSHVQRLNKIGIGHELKFEISTDDKADGMEPVALGLLYHTERMNTTLGVRD